MTHTDLAPDTFTPSDSQRRAIEADPRALLVLAGPGAGKTFCLIERIRFLIEHHGFDPARICAFTFTNKAAGEIAHRLESRLGTDGDARRITRGTIHAFCAELLRKYGEEIGLDPGFGIADEDYQLGVLRRIEGPRRWHRRTLTQFSAFRFKNLGLQHDTLALFDKYERHLERRNILDFDHLVIKAAELLDRPSPAAEIRKQWDVILVDEFQDLNRVQYRVVRALAQDHRHVFAVGDDEQSIYSWAGADRAVFTTFDQEFQLGERRVHLEENRRCPHTVFALARTLIEHNPPIFTDKIVPRADRGDRYAVQAMDFETDDAEAAWLVADIARDRDEHPDLDLGDVAVLYRKHEIGERVESELVNAGIPCRLAPGRALAEDPVVSYLIAAIRVIARPDDAQHRDDFLRTVLPQAILLEAEATPNPSTHDLRVRLGLMQSRLPRHDERGKQIRRATADLRNLEAVGKQHPSVASLVQELLSRRVGMLQSVLRDHLDEISDPASLPEVVRLADRLRDARLRRLRLWISPLGGAEVAIGGMLADLNVRSVRGDPPLDPALHLTPSQAPTLGLPLAVFKAAQLIEMSDTQSAFTSYTAVDLETTSAVPATTEIVEIAAVRVRDGKVVDTYSALVKPKGPIPSDASATHGIYDADVAGAPAIADVWGDFRWFCGDDVIVAHNGHHFDFPILKRTAKELGGVFDLCLFDTLPLARDLFPTSRRLGDLARQLGIPTGQSHRALDDTIALANLLPALEDRKLSRARKTALVHMLGHLGVALALDDKGPSCAEAALFARIARPFALGKYSTCLDWYERQRGDDASLPSPADVIERLGGVALMLRIRAEKTADERYPAVMARLRRLIAEIPDGPLDSQLTDLLERIVLSRWDGHDPERGRVNLLTLHSTKGLEFSRVYIVGAEDSEMPGGTGAKPATEEEIQEARRVLYVGMTRTIDRLVLTRVQARGEKPTGGHRFLDEMGLTPVPPE
jgi:superfamily I DNA/RNA helicase/DNA polymerase III epsilon subunit-like protein